MHHERHGGDDDEHHHGNRVELDAHVKVETFVEERQPREVVRRQCLKDAFGRTRQREILVGGGVRENGHHAEHQRANKARSLMAEPFSADSQQEEGEEWQQKD